jgi:hypothetical protein
MAVALVSSALLLFVTSQEELSQSLILFGIELALAIPIYFVALIFYAKRIRETVRWFLPSIILVLTVYSLSYELVLAGVLNLSLWIRVFLLDTLLVASLNSLILPWIIAYISSRVSSEPYFPFPKITPASNVDDLRQSWANWFASAQGAMASYGDWRYLRRLIDVLASRLRSGFEKDVRLESTPDKNISIAELDIRTLEEEEVSGLGEPGWLPAYRQMRENLRGECVNEDEFKRIMRIVQELRTFLAGKRPVLASSERFILAMIRDLDDMADDLGLFTRKQPKKGG